ncbi:lytic transglycosylase domain-containing protein [Burkholderia territorii]|uniref:lytic transglycosylase domain-containing protein n=1 Tax=Burkholderia territorii TaxID=1503055 RepID=UPI0007571C72|nr:lytic transglycosylase domain-containing protein [Burkholderia territorii]KVG59979.1 lytic transglycosylase [Burkholderia territorii]
MMPLDFLSLAQQCAPQIAPMTMAAIVRTESGFHPYAIGVIHGRLRRQPKNAAEAQATVRMLEAAGWNFSVGLAQVNRANWRAYGLSATSAFEPCRNLATAAAILARCFDAALKSGQFRLAADDRIDVQAALRAGLSCYASGDFSSGYRTGYVQRVVENAVAPPLATPLATPPVPAIAPMPVVPIDAAAPVRAPQSRSAIDRRSGRDRDANAASPATDAPREPDGSAVVF